MMGKNRITLQTLYDIFDQQNNSYSEPYDKSYKWSDYTGKDYKEKLRRLQLSKKPITIIYGHRVKKYKRTENDTNRQAIQDEETIEEIRKMAETEPEPVIYRISKPMENLLKLFNAIGKFSDQPIRFDDSKGKSKKKSQVRKVRKRRKEEVLPTSPSLLKSEPTRIWAGKKEYPVKILPRKKRPEYDVGSHRRKEERRRSREKEAREKGQKKKATIPSKKPKKKLMKSPPRESFFITELTQTEKLRKKGLLDREKEIKHHVNKLKRLLDKRETIKSHVDLLRFPQEEIRRSNLRIEKAKKGSLREYQPKRIILDFGDLFPILSIARARKKKEKVREKRIRKEERERKKKEKEDNIMRKDLLTLRSESTESDMLDTPMDDDVSLITPIFNKEKSKAMFERELKFHNQELEMQRSRKKYIMLQGKIREFNETVKECSDTIREITEDGSFFDRHLLINPITSLKGIKDGDAMSTTTDSLSTRRTGRSFTTRSRRYRSLLSGRGMGGGRSGYNKGRSGAGQSGSPKKTFNWKQDFVETQIRKQMELLEKLRERELDRKVVSKSIDALSNIADRAEQNGLNWVACRMNYRCSKRIRKKIKKKKKKKKKIAKGSSLANRVLTGLSTSSIESRSGNGGDDTGGDEDESDEEGEIIIKVPRNIWRFARESLDKEFYQLEDCVIFYDNLKVYCDQNFLPRTEPEESFLFAIREELIEKKKLTKNTYYRVLGMNYRILADGGDSFEMVQFVRKEIGIGPKEFFKFVKERGWRELSTDFLNLREKWEK